MFIKGEIKKAFRIKDLGSLRTFLGVQFECNLETCELWIHQEMFIDSLLLEYELTDCNAIKTPLDRDHPLGQSTDLHTPIDNLTHSFQHLVGSLLFLQTCSCPDIYFAILLLSQHCSSPEPRHFASAKRVLRYLKGTCSYHLSYRGQNCHLSLSGRQWHGYSRGYRNTDPYPYLQGYIPVYPQVHTPRVLRVLTGKGTHRLYYMYYLFTNSILINKP